MYIYIYMYLHVYTVYTILVPHPFTHAQEKIYSYTDNNAVIVQ